MSWHADDADFVAYVGARWPFLVRSLTLIGCPAPESERLVRTALARCYLAWDEVLGTDDVDVSVYGVVLDGWHRSTGHRQPAEVVEPAPEPVPAPVPVPADEQVPEVVRVRRDLEDQLGRLASTDREVLVLRHVAGLSEEQVADLLGLSVRSVRSVVSPAPVDDFRIACETIDVLAAPIDAVIAEARAQRRRHLRVVLASVVAAVLAVSGVVWLASRPAPEQSSDRDWTVVREPNPVDIPWYAGGELHLKRVVVAMPPIADLVAVGDGALFTGADGTVYFVRSDGAVTELGETDPDARVAASDQTDWVSWVDTSSDVPRLVVHNLVSGKDTAERDLPEGGEVIAVDLARVYFRTPRGDFVWAPGDEPAELDRPGLLDVTSGAQAYQVEGGIEARIEMVQSFYSVSFVRPGTGATISPGGNFVLSRDGDGTAPFRPLLYDVRSGERMRSGLAAGELALDATFGPNHTVSYLVTPRADLAGGPDLDGNSAPLVVLRTCDLAPVVCHDVIPLARPGERSLLAR